MAKGKNKSTGENDYLDQLQWKAQHRRHVPVRFEPKWKYKISYRYPGISPLGRILQFAMLATVLFILAKTAISNANTENIVGIIIVSSIVTLIFIILLFAIRDGSEDDDSKHLDQ